MADLESSRDIVVIGASAGGLNALLEMIGQLPEDLPAALFVVVHTAPDNPGTLPDLLGRRGKLTCRWPVGEERIEHGVIYLAPPDHHLLIKRGYVLAARGPQENGFRPAVDPLFRTAAATYGPRVIGIVLSGGMDDGTYGLIRIRRNGGVAIAQDPEEALVPSMPASAINIAGVDQVLKSGEIARTLERLVRESVTEGEADVARRENHRPDVAEVGAAGLERHAFKHPPSAFSCPECGGALWELRDGELIRYRCHVGHSYTAETLLDHQAQRLEAAMYTALRALEEYAELRRRMALRAEQGRFPSNAARYVRHAEDAEAKAKLIRDLLTASQVVNASGKAAEEDDKKARTKARTPRRKSA